MSVRLSRKGYIGSFIVWRLMNGDYYQSRLFPFTPTHASPPGGITAYIINVYVKEMK